MSWGKFIEDLILCVICVVFHLFMVFMIGLFFGSGIMWCVLG